jgi:hypothetical protein
MKKQKGEENILKTVKKQKHNLACNPDFSLLVALSVPRSAFLAYFQPAGASRRPKRGNPHKNLYVYIGHGGYRG